MRSRKDRARHRRLDQDGHCSRCGLIVLEEGESIETARAHLVADGECPPGFWMNEAEVRRWQADFLGKTPKKPVLAEVQLVKINGPRAISSGSVIRVDARTATVEYRSGAAKVIYRMRVNLFSGRPLASAHPWRVSDVDAARLRHLGVGGDRVGALRHRLRWRSAPAAPPPSSSPAAERTKAMKFDSRTDTFTLRSGRTFRANGGLLSPSDGGSLYEGYDGAVEPGRPFTDAERAEIAGYMVVRWWRWLGRPVGSVRTFARTVLGHVRDALGPR